MAIGPKNKIGEDSLTDMTVEYLERVIKAKLKSLLDAKVIVGVFVEDTDNSYQRLGKQVRFVSFSILYGTSNYIDFMLNDRRR